LREDHHEALPQGEPFYPEQDDSTLVFCLFSSFWYISAIYH